MSGLGDYDLPFTDLERQLVAWVEEVLGLRYRNEDDAQGAVGLPPPESSPREVLESLLRVRQRLDRIEAILQRTVRARGRVTRASQAAKYAADEAWDHASVQSRSSSVRRGDEFTGPRERYADNNLAALGELRTARQGERLASVADEAVDVIRSAYRGLDGLRNDHLAWLRALAFESSLERSG